MYWGAKSRLHDLENVIMELNPKEVEFHYTDEDVKTGNLNGKNYPINYTIHLPEYWEGELIDPCNVDNLKDNLTIYKACIEKGLSLKQNFLSVGKLKVILHPGGATIDPPSEIPDFEHHKNFLYKRLKSFETYLMMFPQFADKIEILVENMPPLPWFYGGQYYSNIFCNPNEIKNYCELNGTGFCFDISHMGLYCNYKGIDLIEAIRIIKPYIRQIHLADASGTDGEGVSIGKGNIDFPAVIEELKNLNVALIPETMFGHKNNYVEFRKTITICNQYIGG